MMLQYCDSAPLISIHGHCTICFRDFHKLHVCFFGEGDANLTFFVFGVFVGIHQLPVGLLDYSLRKEVQILDMFTVGCTWKCSKRTV